jgi:hypothetical protein
MLDFVKQKVGDLVLGRWTTVLDQRQQFAEFLISERNIVEREETDLILREAILEKLLHDLMEEDSLSDPPWAENNNAAAALGIPY